MKYNKEKTGGGSNMFYSVLKKASMLVLFLFSCIALAMPIEARYETTSRKIYPTDSQFQNAPTKYLGIGYLQTVSNPNDVNVIKVKTVGAGAYNIYTTGSKDTVGTIFYKNTFLFWDSYKFLKEDDDHGDALNFRIEADLEENRDVYIGSRLYGSATGNYLVYMEKNLDKAYAKYGGKWTQDDNYMVTDQLSAAERTFYTKEQTALLYDMLTVQTFDVVRELSKSGNPDDLLYYMDLTFGLGLGLATAVVTSGLSIGAQLVIGLATSFVNSAVWSSIPTGSDRLLRLLEAQQAIYDQAGVVKDITDGTLTYEFKYGITETTFMVAEAQWWSYVLAPFLFFFGNIIAGSQADPVLKTPNRVNVFERTVLRYIKGIELDRGTLQVYS